jgi:hypothetical protein
LSLPHGQLRVTDLASGPELQAVHRYGDAIVAIRSHDVRAYALSDGRLLDQARNQYRWFNGRYLRGANNTTIYFALWDGAHVTFEPGTIPSKYLVASVAKIFDRAGLPGPWLLVRSGEVISTESGEVIKLPIPPNAGLDFDRTAVARDGHQLLLSSTKRGLANQPLGCLFDLEQKQFGELVRYSSLPLDRPPAMPTWNVFRIVESIARFEDGIAVCGRNNRWRKLALEEDGKLRITTRYPLQGVAEAQAFDKQYRKTAHGCTVQIANFSGGSKVFLDSRGMLHFKGRDPDLPEVTVMLADGEVAGWTSDGYVCGPAFFFDGPYTSDPKAVFERIMRFFYEV